MLTRKTIELIDMLLFCYFLIYNVKESVGALYHFLNDVRVTVVRENIQSLLTFAP